MTLTTRKPTGRPSWPILLITGSEKTGKSYAAAAASGSEMIGRTLWVTVGEDQPDELGAVPGARFEIVQHQGTYRSILGALDECVTELAQDKMPGLIVLDSATRLWNLLCDEAQAMANARAEKKGRTVGDAGADVTVDLWNTAASRWGHVMDCLRDHQGPSIITARLDVVTVMDNSGKPTKDKDRKVQAHKSLPYDVGAIVELPAPGQAVLTGVRSLRVRNAQVDRRPFRGFTVESLWKEMGLAEDTGTREHAAVASGEDSAAADNPDTIRQELIAIAQAKGIDLNSIVEEWANDHDGAHIKDATDLGSLELFRDDLRERKTAA